MRVSLDQLTAEGRRFLSGEQPASDDGDDGDTDADCGEVGDGHRSEVAQVADVPRRQSEVGAERAEEGAEERQPLRSTR